jgi:endonuclease YncB( thermonuclease family)
VIRAVLLAMLLLPGVAVAQQRAEVIDGDTIRAGGRTVRLVGIDAPELHGACPAETALARRARDRLAQLLAGRAWLTPQGRDRYGRLLAVVRDEAGRDVAQILIDEGLARPYDGRGPRGSWCGARR